MTTTSWEFLAKINTIPPRAWDAIVPRGRIHSSLLDRLSEAVSAADGSSSRPHESVVGARLLQVLVSSAAGGRLGRDPVRGADVLLAEVELWCGTGWPKGWPPPNPPVGWDEAMVFAGGALAAAQLADQYATVPPLREALGQASDRLAARALAA